MAIQHSTQKVFGVQSIGPILMKAAHTRVNAGADGENDRTLPMATEHSIRVSGPDPAQQFRSVRIHYHVRLS